jgi:hypothetical protein
MKPEAFSLMPTLLPTSYFPPISYMKDCWASDEIIIEQFETYTKQTYRNRCEIYGPNGRHVLSVPVRKVNGNHTLSKDILITYDLPWQTMHWRSIETAYNNSPYFLYYRDYFEPFFRKRHNLLLDLNAEILSVLFNVLGVQKKTGLSVSYEKETSMTDLRNEFGRKRISGKDPFREYEQPFRPKHGFLGDLSILDLIFNLGPETSDYLSF